MNITSPYDLNPDLNIPMGEPIDLVALVVKSNAIRCKILSTGQTVTFRHRKDEVEGEILTVIPDKVWRFKNTWYMIGELKSKRIDIPALKLTPLKLEKMFLWEPENEIFDEQSEPINAYQKAVFESGARQEYEMENLLEVKDEIRNYVYAFDDVIELSDSYKYEEALGLIEKILALDLRCLDAHHFLGTQDFNFSDEPSEFMINRAKRHYEVGVKIGELSLPDNFNGVLAWTLIGNRPFLRCLHGYGLSLWRLGELEKAREIFQRMIWMNPEDNQGVRFILADIDCGLSWYDCI